MVRKNQDERVTFRCSPNYHSEGPWYDWAIVDFKTDLFFHKEGNLEEFLHEHPRNKKEHHDPIGHKPQHGDRCVPCKVLAFAQDLESNKIKTLVHGCSFRTTGDKTKFDTVLLEFWQLEYSQETVEQQVWDSASEKMRKVSKTQMQAHLCWVDLDSIVCPCFVVEEEPGIHEILPQDKVLNLNWVMLVRQHRLWAAEFH